MARGKKAFGIYSLDPSYETVLMQTVYADRIVMYGNTVEFQVEGGDRLETVGVCSVDHLIAVAQIEAVEDSEPSHTESPE